MEDEKEAIRSTKGEIEQFKESMVWLDIVDELTVISNNAQREYDLVGESHIDDEGYKVIPNSSETLIHLGDIKGRRKAVSYFLNIPDILIQILEGQENESRRKSAE